METVNSILKKAEKIKREQIKQKCVNAKYPTNIVIDISGEQGNSFAIMGCCQDIARKLFLPKEELEQFLKECTNGDYTNLLKTCQKWFGIIFLNADKYLEGNDQ